jgi:hypothetical protein
MFDCAAQTDHALMQDAAFARALRLCGQTPVVLPDGGVLLHRCLFGVQFAMLPRRTPPDDLALQLETLGLARTPVILSPETPCPLPNALRLKGPQERAVWNIAFGGKTRRALLHQKWRNQLKRAEASPLHVAIRHFCPQSDKSFLRMSQAHAKNCGYANWPAALTLAFAQSAPEQTYFFTARLDGVIVAQMLFLTHGRQATYHIAQTSLEGRRHHAHNLLLWRAAEYLSDLGVDTLDLGLLHKQTPGLNRFKLRTGAIGQKTGGTWLYWRPFARNQTDVSAA